MNVQANIVVTWEGFEWWIVLERRLGALTTEKRIQRIQQRYFLDGQIDWFLEISIEILDMLNERAQSCLSRDHAFAAGLLKEVDDSWSGVPG